MSRRDPDFKAIAEGYQRLAEALETVVVAITAAPGDAAAVKAFSDMLDAAFPYPSDVFRICIDYMIKQYDDYMIKQYDDDFLPKAGDKDIAAVTRARDAFTAMAQSLVTEDPVPLWDSEKELRELGIKYSRRADGYLEVAGSISLNHKDLKSLPDLSNVVVLEEFSAEGNMLRSLKGAPRFVGSSVAVRFNHLNTLEGSPGYVGAHFTVSSNILRDLRFGPDYVGEGYYADNSSMLNSLEGAPKELNGVLHITGNPRLTHLEHAPQKSGGIVSDFGSFKSWAEVPEKLRMEPEKRERLQREFRELVEGVTAHAKGLTRPVNAPKTARFARK